MKGRRKVKTQKWQSRAQFEAEACALAGIKSSNQELFMRVATRNGRIAEPVGAMAGIYNTESSPTRALSGLTASTMFLPDKLNLPSNPPDHWGS